MSRASSPASFTTFRPTARSIPTQGQRFDRASPADRSVRQGPGRQFPAVATTASSARRSASSSTTTSIGKATATCARRSRETVIYETHVRGFTQDPSSEVEQPGTYLGLIEKIPYLKSLGVTAVELMPVHEFPIERLDGRSSTAPNYWGYDPMAFFSPAPRLRRRRASRARRCAEFKQMVRALHAAGIEVILDVVFNHTAEGNEMGPTFASKGWRTRSITCWATAAATTRTSPAAATR